MSNNKMKEYNNEIYATSVASTIQGLYHILSHSRPVDSRRGRVVLFHTIT